MTAKEQQRIGEILGEYQAYKDIFAKMAEGMGGNELKVHCLEKTNNLFEEMAVMRRRHELKTG